jgi:hypothetical protein
MHSKAFSNHLKYYSIACSKAKSFAVMVKVPQTYFPSTYKCYSFIICTLSLALWKKYFPKNLARCLLFKTEEKHWQCYLKLGVIAASLQKSEEGGRASVEEEGGGQSTEITELNSKSD